MSTQETFESFDFDTAEKLLAYMSPLNSKWRGPRPESALYRGHWDANWPLVPTALRSRNWLTDGVHWIEAPCATTEEQVSFELATLKYFWEECDTQGLRLPEDGQTLRKAFNEMEKFVEQRKLQYHFWPPTPMLSLLGLAQHSGVPTRLLDWSWDPHVAAYFAAKSILRTDKPPEAKERLAIWKLLRVVVESQEYNLGKDPEDWPVRLVTAPTADNANLRAQRGAFTLHNTGRLKPTQPPDAPSLDEVLASVLNGRGNPDPLVPLTKLTLPATEAVRLLSLLSQQGYHAGSLFPGFEGVATLVTERRKLSELMERNTLKSQLPERS